jgi:hypothetical protein
MELSELKCKLRNALVAAHPALNKPKLYDRCVNRYVDGVLLAIRDAWATNTDTKCTVKGAFALSQRKLADEIRKVFVHEKQRSIYYMMQEHESTSLLTEIHKGFSFGNNSMLSVVKLNDLYRDMILTELLNLKVEANIDALEDIERNANYTVNVNTASLRSYIAKTQQTIAETDKGQHYSEKLRKNLAAAQRLLAMVHVADDSNATAYLRERWEQADTGRLYGQGYSLQCMTQEVRHAALGVCHKYDFKACAFALMAGLAHSINPTLKLGATLDYITNRAKIRERIAKQTGISVALVKEIFTALGFGAELKNNTHNAIRGALAKAARMQHDSEDRLDREVYNNLGAVEFARLVGNQVFGFIYEELQQINATILQHFDGDDFEIGGNTYNATHPKTGKKRNSRQKLAFIYQAMESSAMLQFAELTGQEVLLTTHDCIYLKRKLSSEQVKDITLQLQETFMYLRFEHEEIWPITTKAHYDSRFTDEIEGERKHRLLIAQQEQVAKAYVSPNNFVQKTTNSFLTDTEYEEQRRQQFMRDVGITEYSVGNKDDEMAELIVVTGE